jgi:transposase
MIASFIAIMPTRPAQPHAPAVERLAEILTMRRQLSDAKVAAENASRLLEDAMLERLSRRRIARLAADIDLLDGRLVEIVMADAALVHRYQLLTSMPGVGPVLACTLIALLPELGRMNRKQVAALVAAFRTRVSLSLNTGLDSSSQISNRRDLREVVVVAWRIVCAT